MKIIKILGIGVGVVILAMLVYSFLKPKSATVKDPSIAGDGTDPDSSSGLKPFVGCVTPPSDRQPYSEDHISWDFTKGLSIIIPQQLRKSFASSSEFNDYVHGAMKAFNVRLNQVGVGKMQVPIIRYLQSSDKRPWYEEEIGRLRCA